MMDPSKQAKNLQPTASMDGIDLTFLPPGITPSDYANMPPEHQFLIE